MGSSGGGEMEWQEPPEHIKNMLRGRTKQRVGDISEAADQRLANAMQGLTDAGLGGTTVGHSIQSDVSDWESEQKNRAWQQFNESLAGLTMPIYEQEQPGIASRVAGLAGTALGADVGYHGKESILGGLLGMEGQPQISGGGRGNPNIGDIASGASAGATIGSVVPGVGTLFGAGMGGLLSGLL